MFLLHLIFHYYNIHLILYLNLLSNLYRNRSKTPERENVKLLSPRTNEKPAQRKSLTRIVLEANTFSKTKSNEKPNELNQSSDQNLSKDDSNNSIECTPMKPSKVSTLMDVSFSPIASKSILVTPNDSVIIENIDNKNETKCITPKTPKFTTMSEFFYEKSVLQSYESSATEESIKEREVVTEVSSVQEKTFNRERFEMTSVSTKSVLTDGSSLITNDSEMDMQEASNIKAAEALESVRSAIQKEKQTIGEIEREIDEIEGISEGTEDSNGEVEEEIEDEAVEELEEDEGDGIEEEEVEGIEGESEEFSESEEEPSDVDPVSICYTMYGIVCRKCDIRIHRSTDTV